MANETDAAASAPLEKENGAIQYVPGKRSHAQLAYYRGKLYVNHKSNDKTEYKRCRHTRKGCLS